MDARTDGDSDHDVDPNLRDDIGDCRIAGLDPFGKRNFSLLDLQFGGLDLIHPRLDKPLHFKLADDPACGNGDQQTRGCIQERRLPSEEAEEKHERHLVDHRRGDQEGEGDAQRDPAFHESDEQRYGRAGAERSDDAQCARHDVAQEERFSFQRLSRFLGRKIGADDPHDKNDGRQEQQHLGNLKDEKPQRLRERGRPIQCQQGIEEIIDPFLQIKVE